MVFFNGYRYRRGRKAISCEGMREARRKGHWTLTIELEVEGSQGGFDILKLSAMD